MKDRFTLLLLALVLILVAVNATVFVVLFSDIASGGMEQESNQADAPTETNAPAPLPTRALSRATAAGTNDTATRTPRAFVPTSRARGAKTGAAEFSTPNVRGTPQALTRHPTYAPTNQPCESCHNDFK